ncbi:MAG TPA: nucleotide exchange factor GrpE [Chthoniobacterales bacterium]|nr:nucleotide exchange factor GrpE [Chthoniobacterales bacterium]
MAKGGEITVPDDFASTMQQLVAEAEKKIGGASQGRAADSENDSALSERLASLERAIAAGFQKLTAPQPADRGETVVAYLERIEAQLQAVRSTEAVNQRLFNSLHDELKNYRDNFLRESLQKPFIRDLVMLLDDLSSIAAQMESGATSSPVVAQWSANLENAVHALLEILHRLEVTEIEPKEKVDRALHRVISYEPADFPEEDGRIIARIKRGFLWHDQVLRMEEVVAKRFS